MTTFLKLKYHLRLTHQAVFFFSPAFQFIMAILQNIFLNLEIFELPRSSVNHNFNNDQYLSHCRRSQFVDLRLCCYYLKGMNGPQQHAFLCPFFFKPKVTESIYVYPTYRQMAQAENLSIQDSACFKALCNNVFQMQISNQQEYLKLVQIVRNVKDSKEFLKDCTIR